MNNEEFEVKDIGSISKRIQKSIEVVKLNRPISGSEAIVSTKEYKIEDIVIPASGLGIRMSNITKNNIPKLMLKLNNKPIIHYAVDEAIEAGIKNIYITSFDENIMTDYIKNNFGNINIIYENERRGSGASILKAEKFIKNNYFAVLFPDLISTNNQITQLLKLFEKTRSNSIGWFRLKYDEKNSFGNSSAISVEKKDNYYKIKKFYNKGEKDSSLYLSRYIISRNFFNKASNHYEKGFDVDDSVILKEMIENEDFFGIDLTGKRFDCGNPNGYILAKSFFG